ncbi:MAG: NTP transferase domain-containing protein [Actinomycetota bacterium]
MTAEHSAPPPPTSALAGVALAAGRGERLRPLTDNCPKVLLTVGKSTLLDYALARLSGPVRLGPDHLAVNAHYLAGQVRAAVASRAHVSVEAPVALGTAGALGNLRDWIDGRHLLVTNADMYLPEGIGDLATTWDGERCRLLCTPAAGRRVDFTRNNIGLRYAGVCVLPWTAVRNLTPTPTGLYEVLWRAAEAAGSLDITITPGPAIDCGTSADYQSARTLSRESGDDKHAS